MLFPKFCQVYPPSTTSALNSIVFASNDKASKGVVIISWRTRWCWCGLDGDTVDRCQLWRVHTYAENTYFPDETTGAGTLISTSCYAASVCTTEWRRWQSDCLFSSKLAPTERERTSQVAGGRVRIVFFLHISGRVIFFCFIPRNIARKVHVVYESYCMIGIIYSVCIRVRVRTSASF